MMRALRFFTLVACLYCLPRIASAGLSITFWAPENNQLVMPGQTIPVTVSVVSDRNYLTEVSITCTDYKKYTWTYSAFDAMYLFMNTVDFKIPVNAPPNTTYVALVTAKAQGESTFAYRSVKTPADADVPTYPSPSMAGVRSADRLVGNKSATVAWFEAQDSYTSASSMKYEIYYDTNQANVFSSGVKQTVTGVLSTTVTGLSATTDYYVGVRAVDLGKNRDMNTHAIRMGFYKNAARPSAWMMYQ